MWLLKSVILIDSWEDTAKSSVMLFDFREDATISGVKLLILGKIDNKQCDVNRP